MSKAIDRRLSALEAGSMNAKRLEYLSALRLDVGPAQALHELLSLPDPEQPLYLRTLSDETIDALQTALARHLETTGDTHEPETQA